MFQLYSGHQAYLQSLVELYMLNVYGMWNQVNGPDCETDVISYSAEVKTPQHAFME
jgi:hypothetical protein